MFIGNLLSNIDIKKAVKKETAKDVIDKIFENIKKEDKNVPFMKVMMTLLAVKDNKDVLDWLHSECCDYKHRKGSYSIRFWGGFKDFPQKGLVDN